MKSRLWLLAGLMLFGTAQAAPQEESGAAQEAAAAAAEAPDPAVALRDGVDQLLTFLNSDPRPSAEELADFLEGEIAPYFDFEFMAQLSVGRMFDRLDAADQGEITDQIKRSFLGTMTARLAGYSNQQVQFFPPRVGDDGRGAQVSVAILNPGTYPSRLDFRLYRTDGDWRVYDVSANGRSAVVHYRQQMMRQMAEMRMRRMRREPGAMMPSMQRGGMPPFGTGYPR